MILTDSLKQEIKTLTFETSQIQVQNYQYKIIYRNIWINWINVKGIQVTQEKMEILINNFRACVQEYTVDPIQKDLEGMHEQLYSKF